MRYAVSYAYLAYFSPYCHGFDSMLVFITASAKTLLLPQTILFVKVMYSAHSATRNKSVISRGNKKTSVFKITHH